MKVYSVERNSESYLNRIGGLSSAGIHTHPLALSPFVAYKINLSSLNSMVLHSYLASKRPHSIAALILSVNLQRINL